MSKTLLQTQFDHFVSHRLGPVFKARGYRKTGHNFRYYDASGWGKIVNLQKSQSSDRHHIRFTLNIGLYLLEAERLWRHSGHTSREKFFEPDCLIRKRLGDLQGSGLDPWYELTEQTDPARLFQQVEQDVATQVLPYLDRFEQLETILQHLVQERRPNSALAIKTLYVYGYQQQARAWVAEEIATTIYRGHRQQMLLAQATLDSLL